MKKRSISWIFRAMLLGGVFSLILFHSSCKKDEEPEQKNPVASFQYEISSTNFLEVKFTNFSQNATSYVWEFGDGETSTEKDPTHVYAAAGDFTVKLTAKNDAGASAIYSQTFTITDPDEAFKLLTGDVSKTWKLFREGTCMSLGPSAENPAGWWAGLQNDGARPCLYQQEFTFHFDGTYVFNDNGMFWGEYGVWSGDLLETCFDAIPANMVNADGQDVSAWLSGTHAFAYEPSTGTLTLNGNGAWIGIPKLGPTAETTVPIASTSCKIEITQETGYDVMTVVFDYGVDVAYWKIVYVHYYDPSLEPELVLDEEPYGEDLPDLTPDEMWNTFETPTSFVLLDTAHAFGAASAANNMTLNIGVADPAGGATNVAEYIRVGTYQELQFFMDYDIQFDNFTTMSVDVYMPSSNNYTGTLTKGIALIIGEHSQTEQWWTAHIQYDAEATVLDEWVTYTFQLDSPTSGAGSYTPYERNDLDFFAISLGGGGHNDQGTFYIRNFRFE